MYSTVIFLEKVSVSCWRMLIKLLEDADLTVVFEVSVDVLFCEISFIFLALCFAVLSLFG